MPTKIKSVDHADKKLMGNGLKSELAETNYDENIGLDSASDYESDSESDIEGSTQENSHRQKSGVKSVSAAEVRAAREASETFKSNVFKLQIDEVLKEISVDEKYVAQARKLLFSLREKISSTTPVGPLSYNDAQKALTTRIPFPHDASKQAKTGPEIKYKLGFVPPSLESINVIGSWSLHTTVRRPARTSGIDLLVPMSASLFDNKDYLDFRYHRKRAFFLAVLASQLAECGLPVEPRFENFNGHPYKPTLQLVPVGNLSKLGKRVTIYVHVFPEESVQFPLTKLAPHRNANRAVDGPTPIYNWSVLSDVCAMPLIRYLHATAAATPAFADAARLGALWLQQRRWGSNPMKGGFGAFEFAMTLAALLNGGTPNGKKRLLSGFSSYQLFKGALLYIAESENIALQGSLFDRTQPIVSTSTKGLLFSDCGLDVLTNIAPWASKLLRHDAQLAVDMLNDDTRDRFEFLFLRDCGQTHLRFDIELEINLNNVEENKSVLEVASEINDLLNKAWGPRYLALYIKSANESVQGSLQSSWPLSSDMPAANSKTFFVGAILHPENADKRVTFVGPEVKNDSNIFKSFWGPKASLRRFQDGSIKDAVVWVNGSRSIVQEAAVYALTRHLDAEVVLPQHFERKLPSANEISTKVGSGFLAINTSFQKLSQVLQDLRGSLPLRIISLYGTSSELRSASVAEPSPFDPSHIAEGVIEMETSSRWPADVEAIEKVKSAFLIKIAETMRQLHPKYYIVIGLEPAIDDPTVEAAFAVIQTPEGFYFKLRILARTNRPSNNKLTELADHTRLISTMVNRYSDAFSKSMRLTKYWLERQMLMSHITEPAVELLVLHVFANSAPWAPPVSPTTAFWRVIDLLSRWDWRETNLVIDVDRHVDSVEHHIDRNQLVYGCDMDFSMYQSIQAAFTKQRNQDPALTEAPWVIATKLDPTGVRWTKWDPRSRVAPVIASRVTALARAAKPNMRIFDVSISDFDVVWNVKAPKLTSMKNKNIVVSDPHKAIIGSHNIALDLVTTLTKLYKDTLVLFYSGSLNSFPQNEHVLCGIWNRQALDSVPKLKASISYPLKESDKGFELDKCAVLSEIERLGAGMLHRS